MSLTTLPDRIRDWFKTYPRRDEPTRYRWELTVTERRDGEEQTATDSGTVTISPTTEDEDAE